MSPIIIAPPISGEEVWTWIDPDGDEHPLTSASNIIAEAGAAELWMPPNEIVEDVLPFQGGSRVRRVATQSRRFDFPMLLQGTTRTGLFSLIDSVLWWFDPTRGNGILRYLRADGTERQITCRAVGGLGINRAKGQAGPLHQHVMLDFHAGNPDWYATEETTGEAALGDNVATWFPIFPLVLTSSTIFADTTVLNPGQIETWPRWTINGPGVDPVIRNVTTGKTISITRTLALGDQIVIETDPRTEAQQVRDGSGNNLWAAIRPGSDLWPLAAGVNDVRLELGLATVDSSITYAFRTRFRGP